jgi:hypothetical protein
LMLFSMHKAHKVGSTIGLNKQELKRTKKD